MLETVEFSKKVKITNKRLALFFFFFSCFGAFAMHTFFLYQEGYLVKKAPKGRVQFWATNWDVRDQKASEINELAEHMDHCKSSKKYEFCDTPDCKWIAKDIACMDLCTQSNTGQCLEANERWVKDETTMFFPTYFHDKIVTKQPAMTAEGQYSFGNFKRTAETQKSYFVKGVEELGIEFGHTLMLTTEDSAQLNSGTSPCNRVTAGTDCVDRNVLTIVKDSSGNEIERREPGKWTSLSIRTLLMAAGISLDNLETTLGRNYLQNATFTDAVFTRVTGTDLDIKIEYHTRNSRMYLRNAFIDPYDWPGIVAVVTVEHHSAWASKPQLQIFDQFGSQRLRYMQGLNIRFIQTGAFAEVSWSNILNHLIGMVIVINISRKMVEIFALNFLGTTSTMYKGLTVHKSHLDKKVCALATRLVSHISVFTDLKDSAQGITEELMNSRFTKIFRSTQMNSEQIKDWTKFVHNHLDRDHNGGINMEEFATACSHGEDINFKALVEMLDGKTRPTFFETVFADPSLKDLRKELHAHAHFGFRLPKLSFKFATDTKLPLTDINHVQVVSQQDTEGSDHAQVPSQKYNEDSDHAKLPSQQHKGSDHTTLPSQQYSEGSDHAQLPLQQATDSSPAMKSQPSKSGRDGKKKLEELEPLTMKVLHHERNIEQHIIPVEIAQKEIEYINKLQAEIQAEKRYFGVVQTRVETLETRVETLVRDVKQLQKEQQKHVEKLSLQSDIHVDLLKCKSDIATMYVQYLEQQQILKLMPFGDSAHASKDSNMAPKLEEGRSEVLV
eukprot:gnl/MRDRNA2_/MRDRNA2_34433_c0_seq1.p1 gnl/MRDRNA2_/MRDRNA2_34433_c0~~gnl/MRDRNA2_/MRDRNA2_34433_c0_seq1.p1  ORF type:complete len:813 (+),score=128.41 gnl/MRDRNA2_/MRDRNA2_34433_c0_seq1:93-2441(+)